MACNYFHLMDLNYLVHFHSRTVRTTFIENATFQSEDFENSPGIVCDLTLLGVVELRCHCAFVIVFFFSVHIQSFI